MRALAQCHPQKFAKGRGLCGACYDKVLKKENPAYKKRQLENKTKWSKLHPEAKKRYIEKARQKRKMFPELTRLQNRIKSLKKYNITPQIYDDILKAQGGGCALCFRLPGKFNFHVDHHHSSNRIRGILCHQCNWYLGVIDADPQIILRIIKYLYPETTIDISGEV